MTSHATGKIPTCYQTALGAMLIGQVEHALEAAPLAQLKGKVNLIFTSPPFPLVHKKRYGNKTGEEYLEWIRDLAPKFTSLLAPDGSIVLEVGNAWEQGAPVMSTLPLRSLLAFQAAANLHLCQQVICHNPARLPSPAQWVTIERIRLKDSYTHLWWMSPTPRPKADNRKVLTPYGNDMKRLLKKKTYNSGRRPSGHVISEEGFLKNHGGAISANALDFEDLTKIPGNFIRCSNTKWDSKYVEYCREHQLEPHPARMRTDLAAFFIEFLTDPNDIIFDPFAGSNTTGAIAEELGRRWLGVEAQSVYAEGSRGRFEPEKLLAPQSSRNRKKTNWLAQLDN